jgi:hypothetical protein
MTQHATPWRQVVVDQLSLLASEPEQLAYENGVPHVDITRELVCGWFDDSYHPTDKQFRANFGDDELAALAGFSTFFHQCLGKLPISHGTVKTWLGSATWREVMNAAAHTLRQLAA